MAAISTPSKLVHRRQRIDRSLARRPPGPRKPRRLEETLVEARHAAEEMARASAELEAIAAAGEVTEHRLQALLLEPLARIELVRRFTRAILHRHDRRARLAEET
jgi:hypothetical protein